MTQHSRLKAAFDSSEKDGNRLAVFAASLQCTDEVKDLPSGTPWSWYFVTKNIYIFKRAEDRRKRLFLGEGYLPKTAPMKLAPKTIRRRPLTTIPILVTPVTFEGCALRFRPNSYILPQSCVVVIKPSLRPQRGR